MVDVQDYVLGDRIHVGARSMVYRARDLRDDSAVVIKLLRSEHPTREDVQRFQREFDMLSALDMSGVVRVRGMIRKRGRLGLVMEDVGARSLRSLMAERRLTLPEILEIAHGTARILDELHRRRIVHCDVNPSNIVVVPETLAVWLVDFQFAARLSRDGTAARKPNLIEGTLRYLSPEQTGRMNRAVDHTTDFYSLGVTLHELAAGAPPFSSDDPLELLHAHIAREPPSLSALCPELPASFCTVVAKLLAKTAEQRYQSGHGLAHDLEVCLEQARGKAPAEPLVPGLHDASDRFHIPQKLYGREEARDVLLATFERASRGRAELMVVAGYSGIGKSALVHEIHRPIVEKRGFFISGKFDQLERNAPYEPIFRAFSDLLRQTMGEREERLTALRERLRESLGHNASVIAELVPGASMLLGPTPQAPPLPPNESQRRLHFAFDAFVSAFASESSPLVFFLDDLQWADAGSLSLLQALLGNPNLYHFHVIASYRDNEVGEGHPLLSAIEAIRNSGTTVTRLELRPLRLGDVNALVMDTLRCDAEEAAPLATTLLRATAGNPFFLSQMLVSLHEDGHFVFDPVRRSYRWDLTVTSRALTGDVVDLMASRIRKLSAPAGEALRFAACIGSRFDVATLAELVGRPEGAIAQALAEAVDEGLILPLGEAWSESGDEPAAEDAGNGAPEGAFRFLHDRVQQAAYSLIPEEERKDVHLRLGRLLVARTPKEAIRAHVFDIVNQLALGRDRITAPEERRASAELALEAGKKAKSAAAWEPSDRYLRAGLELLPEGAPRELAFELCAEAAEAAYLTGDGARAEALAVRAMELADRAQERVRVLETRMHNQVAQSRMKEVVDTALEALAVLGLHLPPTPTEADIGAALGRAALAIGGRTPDELFALPMLEGERELSTLRILAALFAPVYIVNPPLFVVAASEMVALCATHGNSRYATVAYTMYSTLQSGVMGDYDAANAYADLAQRLLGVPDAWTFCGNVHLLTSIMVKPWTSPFRDTVEPLREGVRSALEAGDIEYGGYCGVNCATVLFWAGAQLDAVAEENRQQLALLEQLKLTFHRCFLRVFDQGTQNLLGQTSDPLALEGDSFQASKELEVLIEGKNLGTLVVYHGIRSMLACIFGHFEQAVEDAASAEPILSAQAGQMPVAQHAFYQSIALLASCPGEGDDARRAALEKAEKNLAQVRAWARHAPMNFQHKVDLIEAERARALGDSFAAMSHYERAIRGAAENRYAHEEALAHERCADLCFSLGWERTGESHLQDAHAAYVRWGAIAKTEALEKSFPGILATRAGVAAAPAGVSASERREGSTLELATMMKAARAISGEIVLERLVRSLMCNMVENAGAERGVLLLEKDGDMVVAGRWSVAEGEGSAEPVAREDLVPSSIVQYAARTGESVVLRDAAALGRFTRDAYVSRVRPRSILCAPLSNQGRRVGVVYLENTLTADAFTADRLEVIEMLSAQAALSIHNATLYATLEQKVVERTQELSERNRELAATLTRLEETQAQLVMQEKLASLGAMTAGIAHEIKNPLNFVTNFAESSIELTRELAEALEPERERLTTTALEDIDDVLAHLRQSATKIEQHGRRANQILSQMLMHARGEASRREATDLNALCAERIPLGLDGLAVELVTDYDPSVGLVAVSPEDVTRVLVNVAANASHAIREKRRMSGPDYVPKLWISTKNLGDRVEVRIRDNGTGIASGVLARIFEPFYTTKKTGEGTGLGLSIAHDIVVRGHGGDLRAESAPGEYTEIIMMLPRRT